MARWSARRTRNPAVSGSSPALATCWICSLSSRVQIFGLACNSQLAASCPLGLLILLCFYLDYLFQSYLSGMPVN